MTKSATKKFDTTATKGAPKTEIMQEPVKAAKPTAKGAAPK